MAQPITMPKLGQTVEEGLIVQWHKKEGEVVAKGDILFDIETDKAVLEVESFFEGTLLKIVVPEGQTVPVQAVVGFVGASGEPIPEVQAPPPKPKKAEASATPAERPVVHQRDVQAPPAAAPVPPERQAPARFSISPRAKKLAQECVIDPTNITGTGPGERVVQRDVEAYLAAKGYARLRISPAAKNLAAQEGIDVLALQGTGDSDRIMVADVQRAVAEKPKPMSKMRQAIARRLTHSFTTTPHFFVTVAADMTDLIAFRAERKQQGAPYTITDFLLMAAALSLREFPQVNSTTEGKMVQWHSKVHLGLAVSLERGLVVPVIRNADDLTLEEVHHQAAELADKARAGALSPKEMTGSTFTISNMGMLDVENFTAIINPGESAILAVSSIVRQPVARDDRVVIRSIMKMTLSSDHRIIDGALAAKFANAIRNKLEDISLWKRLT